MATAAHRTRRGRFGLLLGTLFAATVFAAVAYADIVETNVVTTGTAQTDTITAGGSTTISYRIQVQGTGLDGQGGCNASDGSPVTIALSVPAAVTATSTAVGWNPVAKTLTHSACGDGAAKAVTFSSGTPGDYPINVSSITDAGEGTYVNDANWTLHVNAPPNTAPVLTVPADFSFEGNTLGGAFVTFAVSVADAEDDPDPTPTCSKSSGEFFPIGETTVSCSVTDSGGMVDSESFKVTVVDTTAPTVLVPANITAEATSAAGAVVTYSASADDHVDGPLSPTCSPASGSTFPIGTTGVSCSATDAAGNTSSSSFNVTVRDTTAPSVTVPGDIVAEATGPTGAVVNFSASADDAVGGAIATTCLPVSGSTFPLGPTEVTCSATDAAGNTGSASFDVTVVDTTPPSVDVPADIVAEATGPGGAAVNFTATAVDLVDGPLSPTCEPASGSTFALGATTVNCSATDAAGNTGSASFKVTIVDTTPPVVTVPADMTAEATGPGGAVVSFTASAEDLVDGPLSPTCSPASGSTFEVGTTVVTCSATDAAGNTGSASFDVTVRDTTPPSLDVPEDIVAEATGPGGAAVSFTATAQDIVDGSITPICSPASGSTFTLGTTPVSCSATDNAGNSTTAGFDVRVRDTTAPSVDVPDDIVAEATGPGGAAVNFTASAADLVDGALTPTCSPASGSTFGLGPTDVTCSATDAAGNTGSASFKVTVQDTTAPSVTVPADKTAEATGPSGAAVTYTASASDLVDGPITPTCAPASGSTFALGTTTVHCSATDAAGNTGSASFKVTVQDTTAPSLALPADMTVAATDPSGAIVTYSASASDLVDGPVAVDCSPASGSTFAPGTTTVQCSATDAAGNTATGSFKVRVTYQLRGFYQPVDMSGSSQVWNTVKGGSTVPLKFEVFAGATELTSTSVVNQPLKATQVPCSGGTEDTIELAATGGTVLRYDETSGQFIYNWQTPKKPGFCYAVTVSTTEGSSLVAYFKLK